jgi:hypothetical protein
MITRRPAIWLLATFLLALLPALPVHAQRQKASTEPRAVGVLEWTSVGLRLVPVSLMLDGRFYDATLYRANPVPMSVEQDTVYQVQKSGEALGDFTVTSPAQLPNGAWIGQGSYESDADRKKKAEDRAKASAAAAASAAKPVNPEEERPVLRHGSAKTETPAPSTTTAPSTPAPASPAPAAAPATSQSTPTAPPPTLTETDSDPNRPVLKRGKPGEEQAQKLGKEDLPHKAPPKQPPGIEKIQVAVSDAGPGEPHPYVWKWNKPEEEKKFRADAEKMAMALVRDYAKKNGGPTPGKMEVTGFNAFDLAYNNEPDVVFTARVLPAPATAVKRAGAKAAPPPVPWPNGFEYYITLVAREDIYAQMQKSFAQVTDNKHLDAFPRYELIDAVDADGDHNGELLFRSVNDVSSSFVIYRVTGYRLEELLRVPEPREMDTGF